MHTGTAKQKQAGADVTYSVLVDPDVTHTVRGRGKDFVSERGEYTSEVGTCNDMKVPAMVTDIEQRRVSKLHFNQGSNMHARIHFLHGSSHVWGPHVSQIMHMYYAMTLVETSQFIYTHISTYFLVVFKHHGPV